MKTFDIGIPNLWLLLRPVSHTSYPATRTIRYEHGKRSEGKWKRIEVGSSDHSCREWLGGLYVHLPIDHQPSNIYYSKISTHLYQGNISYKDFLSDFVVFHRQWEATPSGNWTRRLIPHIETWVKRTHGELDYFLTQLMSGHGNYAAYLHRFGIMDSGECAICQVEETPEHKFFECKATENHRRKLEKTAGRATPEKGANAQESTTEISQAD